MKIHLLSDLHTEFWRSRRYEELVRPADVLVLAGDIAVGRNNVLDVINSLSPHYKNVIYIPGNHEYYKGLPLDGFEGFEAQLPTNVHFHNPGQVVIHDVTFITGTLWTNFREDPLAELDAQRGIVDFQRIPNCTPQKLKELFYQHSQYFKLAYENRKTEKVVFVSHFMPAIECISPRWRGANNSLNKYFANDLSSWIEELDCAHWLFGHTHDSVDVMVGQTRLLARPLGYPGEHQQPYKHLILDV